MLRSLAASLVLLVASACDTPALPNDGGTSDSGRDSGTSATQCGQDSECGDQTLFCARWRCRPGEAGADARGCLDLGPLCDPGQGCDEARDQCGAPAWCTDGRTGCMQPGDCDGDGERATQCGGTDCDDEDAARFHANAEVCDAAGHDEDCSDVTLAGESDGDLDGDGFVGEGCCNGATCGDDCDDADRATHPGARELCNGRDDDCNGAIDDEGATPLCPGGTCVAGHCNLMGWDRTFGDTMDDMAISVAMDELGRVYVAGLFTGTVRFGASPVSSVGGSADAFVAAYGADGTYRWVRTFGSAGFDQGSEIAIDPVSGRVFVIVAAMQPIDLGGGTRANDGPSTILLALDSDGTYAWDRELATFTLVTLDARDGVVIAGSFAGSRAFDLGAGALTRHGTEDGFIARYASDGTYQWQHQMSGASSTSVRTGRVTMDAAGRVYVAGRYMGGTVDLGRGDRANNGTSDIFAIGLDSGGTAVWDYTAGGTGTDFADIVRADASDRIFVAGGFAGSVDFGGGDVAASTSNCAFLLQLDSSGAFTNVQQWGGGATNEATSVAVSSSGHILVGGSFSGAVDFGGGLRTAPTTGAGFLVTFDSALNYFADRMFSYPGAPAVPCPSTECSATVFDLVVGPADSTALVGSFSGVVDLGSGSRTSAGATDGFIVRLPN